MKVAWESILIMVRSTTFDGIVIVRLGEFGACAEV